MTFAEKLLKAGHITDDDFTRHQKRMEQKEARERAKEERAIKLQLALEAKERSAKEAYRKRMKELEAEGG